MLTMPNVFIRCDFFVVFGTPPGSPLLIVLLGGCVSSDTKRKLSHIKKSTWGIGSTPTAMSSIWSPSSTTARPSSKWPSWTGWHRNKRAEGKDTQLLHGALTVSLQRIHSQFKKEVFEKWNGRRHVSEPAKHGWDSGHHCKGGLQQPAGGGLPGPGGGSRFFAALFPGWQ